MKRIVKLLVFLIIPYYGMGHKTDVWEVYVNDSLVAEFSERSKDLSFKISSENIHDTDKITVRYYQNTDCSECLYEVIVQDEQNRKLIQTKGIEHFGKHTFLLKSLLEVGKKNNSKEYHFFYRERSNTGKQLYFKLALILTFV